MQPFDPDNIRENYQFLLRHLDHPVFRLGIREEDGAIVYLLNEGPLARRNNTATDTVYGRSPEEVLGPEVAAEVMPWYERAFGGETCSFERVVDGAVFETVLTPIEEDGRVVGVAGTGCDITERRRFRVEVEGLNSKLQQADEALKQAVETDPLTGLSNLRKFDSLFEYELVRASRYRKPFCLILGDADRFREMNEKYGRRTGDAILCTLADIFRFSIRDTDTVARRGGEEFAFLLPETDREGALIAGEKLLQRIHEFDFGKTPGVTVSFGIAVWQNGDDAEMLIRRAEQALSRAKKAGRDRLEME